MVIDSHVHFWKYDKKRFSWISNEMKLLKQDYLPEHLALSLKRNGIDGCIAVQADDAEVETRFLVELAQTHPEIKGVIGWLDPESDSFEEKLSFFSQYPIIKGWRYSRLHNTGDYLLTEKTKEAILLLGQRGFTFDLLLHPEQLAQASRLAASLPGQIFVLDHGGKPLIAVKEINSWKNELNQLAKNRNVFCKISGLLTETSWKNWSPADFYPYLDVLFEAFSPQRLLFGSDWPVMLLSGMYVQWKSLIEKYMENHTEEERQAVFGGNAMAVYKLL